MLITIGEHLGCNMSKIVLLMCGLKKKQTRTTAKDMYTSDRFRKSLEYAFKLTDSRNVYILSAQYGLLELETVIDNYDKSLYSFSHEEKTLWAKKVLNQLKIKTNIENDIYVFLTDDDYNEYLVPLLKNIDLPLKGLGPNQHKEWFIHKLS